MKTLLKFAFSSLYAFGTFITVFTFGAAVAYFMAPAFFGFVFVSAGVMSVVYAVSGLFSLAQFVITYKSTKDVSLANSSKVSK